MITNALAYIESLYGCPYGYWTGRHIQRDNTTPFYAALPNEPLPARDTLVSQGIACTGLLNLLCRHAGLVVPGVLDPTELHPGGTLVWGVLQSYPEPWDPLHSVRSPPGVTFTPLPEVVVIDDNEVACYYDSFCPPAIYLSALQRLR